jgi:hypothetical protein
MIMLQHTTAHSNPIGRVNEPKFWHNYFYRVMLIKQSVFDGEDTKSDQVFEGAEDVEVRKFANKICRNQDYLHMS